MEKLLETLKRLPTWARIAVVSALALIAFCLSMTSCSRSVLRFRGQGDIDYMYQGSSAPNPSALEQNKTR